MFSVESGWHSPASEVPFPIRWHLHDREMSDGWPSTQVQWIVRSPGTLCQKHCGATSGISKEGCCMSVGSGGRPVIPRARRVSCAVRTSMPSLSPHTTTNGHLSGLQVFSYVATLLYVVHAVFSLIRWKSS